MKRPNTRKRAKGVKSDLDGFAYSFSCLPFNQMVSVKKEIMRDLGWSVANFYYKKSGDSPMRDYEEIVVAAILNRFGIDIRKEKPITK